MDAKRGVGGKMGWASVAMLAVVVVLVGSVSVAAARTRMRASMPLALQAADTACAAFLPLLKSGSSTEAQRDSAYACVRRVDSERRRRADSSVAEDLRLPRAYYAIPEYHDEQRLPVSGPGTTVFLGPKAGIYASGYLGAFSSEWQYAEHGDTGVFVAHVYVDPDDTPDFPSTYRDLGLKPGLNCVWMVHENPVPDAKWMAYVRPARLDAMCDPTYGDKTDLRVVRTSAAGANAALYPPVARFGETTTGLPLLGVKCLAGWCEMGAQAAWGNWAPRRPLTVQYPQWDASNERAVVKGWHDEQVLSIQNAAGQWVQSSTRAAVVPESGLDMAPTRFSEWTPVATIYLEATPPVGSKYERWGLRRGPNLLELRREGAAATERWLARITRAGVSKTWRVMERCVHRDVVVPGTARFRWTILDDGIWAPCGQACCQVQGDE